MLGILRRIGNLCGDWLDVIGFGGLSWTLVDFVGLWWIGGLPYAFSLVSFLWRALLCTYTSSLLGSLWFFGSLGSFRIN